MDEKMRHTLKLGAVTPEELCKMTGASLRLLGGADCKASVTGITTDTREIMPGDVYVAIKGEHTDGHALIKEAFAAGAAAVIAERMPDDADGVCGAVCLVGSSVDAVGDFAHSYKKRSNAKTVAVTGSVGKTTTKEFISSVLSQRFTVHKTEGNHNNELGLPMSLFDIGPDTDVSVLEMGMTGLGEIERLSLIAEPDYGIITNIGSSHLEQLGSRENICKAKMEIVSGLKKGGELVLCADEPLLLAYRQGEYNPTYVSVYNSSAEFRAVNIRYENNRTEFDLLCNRRVITNIVVPALGLHHVYAALFAYAIGQRFGLDDNEIKNGIASFRDAGMRQSIYEVAGITVIDGSYNASPESMRASLDVLGEMAREAGGARKLALLGDMRELGTESRLMHEQIGAYAAQKKLDYLFTYGLIAESIAQAAAKGGMEPSHVFANPDINSPCRSGEMICSVARPGDILLVKASRAVSAEKIIGYIKENLK